MCFTTFKSCSRTVVHVCNKKWKLWHFWVSCWNNFWHILVKITWSLYYRQYLMWSLYESQFPSLLFNSWVTCLWQLFDLHFKPVICILVNIHWIILFIYFSWTTILIQVSGKVLLFRAKQLTWRTYQVRFNFKSKHINFLYQM